MNQQQQTIQAVIDYIEPIPDDQWCIGNYYNTQGQCCFYGHLIKNQSLVKTFDEIKLNFPHRFVFINDGTSWFYKQPTPKARILAALNDFKQQES